MCDYNIPVFAIRRKKKKKETDCERFWYYKTKEEAEDVAKKLSGYKVSVERWWSNVPFDELVKGNRTRYPNL